MQFIQERNANKRRASALATPLHGDFTTTPSLATTLTRWPTRKYFILLLAVLCMVSLAPQISVAAGDFQSKTPSIAINTNDVTHATLRLGTNNQQSSSAIHNGYFDKNCFLIYIHFHKAGGTSMVDMMMHQFHLNSIATLGTLQNNTAEVERGPDLYYRILAKNNLLISSAPENMNLLKSESDHRAGQPNFWTGLKKRGCDFESLEYNFITPAQFHNLANSFIQFWTLLRDPWSRFRSTYERELFIECNRLANRSGMEVENCIKENSLEAWMKSGNIDRQYPRGSVWGGLLYPNYYVRMLNGINDQIIADPSLITEIHLERAKSVLRRFDLVVLLEDQIEVERKIESFFNQTLKTVPKLSNNDLKQWPMYDRIVAQANQQMAVFEEQNILDRKLYDFVKNELLKETR